MLSPRAAESSSAEAEPGSEPLAVADLVCRFGGVVAVDGVSFGCPAGEITGLIGPNGAGKSSVIGAIAGSAPVAGGRVMLGGTDVTRMPGYQRARIGLARTFQISSICPTLTVLENVLLGYRDARAESLRSALLGSWRWRRAERQRVEEARDLLERVGMLASENELGSSLSGGQRRLVEIARVLMARPTTLLLDEPTAGVNRTLANRIASELTRLASEGIAVLMVEHELKLVERICSNVIVMARGRILASGSMETHRANPEVVAAYLGA